jgi:hypothetical protein
MHALSKSLVGGPMPGRDERRREIKECLCGFALAAAGRVKPGATGTTATRRARNDVFMWVSFQVDSEDPNKACSSRGVKTALHFVRVKRA